MNLLHTNIDVHSRRLISEFPADGVKFISKLQSHCANMTLLEKVDMIDFFNMSHIKDGNQQWIISRYSKTYMLYHFQKETVILDIN